MEQEVRITVTLSVDARLSKNEIRARFYSRLQETNMRKDGLTIMDNLDVIEEAELYGNDSVSVIEDEPDCREMPN